MKFTTLVAFSILTGSILMGLVLGGCSNTFNGAGKDIERAGQSIQRNF